MKREITLTLLLLFFFLFFNGYCGPSICGSQNTFYETVWQESGQGIKILKLKLWFGLSVLYMSIKSPVQITSTYIRPRGVGKNLSPAVV